MAEDHLRTTATNTMAQELEPKQDISHIPNISGANDLESQQPRQDTIEHVKTQGPKIADPTPLGLLSFATGESTCLRKKAYSWINYEKKVYSS